MICLILPFCSILYVATFFHLFVFYPFTLERLALRLPFKELIIILIHQYAGSGFSIAMFILDGLSVIVAEILASPGLAWKMA
jgi:hypothetical protein